MRYAVIDADGVITNVIWLHPMNQNDFPNAVPIPHDMPVGIGNVYVDGSFYADGEKILTLSEQAQLEMDDMKAALANLGVTDDE